MGDGLSGGLRAEVRESFRRGSLVVTANERAARTVRRGWDEVQRAEGMERWEPARALSWAAWTAGIWRQMVVEGRARSLLLNGFQERAVWREVLAADEGSRGLRGLDGLAGMAAESWARVWAHVARPERRPGGSRVTALLERWAGESRDAATFARWARAFEGRCAAERWVTAAELDAVLAEAVRSGRARVEVGEVLLVGFDRRTPSQEALVGSVRGAGVEVSDAEIGVRPDRRVLVSAADEVEEARACARWAARWMERGARVAVIVADVAEERAGMERVFREVLAPEMEAITAGEAGAPYAFSLGRRLDEVPMVAVALQLLRWCVGALPMGEVSGLVVSEYVAGGMGEGYARAEFDERELRRGRALRPEMELGAAVRRMEGWKGAARVPGLLGAVRRMERMAAGFAGREGSFGGWADGFREYLREAGWGAAGTETSEEFQVRERWEGALDAMATLDFAGQVVGVEGALRALAGVVRETVFATEGEEAEVQVMGPLEAAGSEFDAVWLLRAGETSWPPRTGRMPLLGWALERELEMPGADAVREMEWARRLTGRIVASGREVVVSYAGAIAEGKQRAAGVVRGLGLAEVDIAEVAGKEAERVVMAVERVEDVAGIRFEGAAVGGGARVLELQAACGFRAFAEVRLQSREPEERGLGMDARVGGDVVHGALESFWEQVGSQAELRSMSAEQRSAVLGQAIEAGLRKGLGRMPGEEGAAWEKAYVEVQRARLRRLLERWLKEEMLRPEFRVMRRESQERVEVGGLRLSLRVDRVDEVDGRLVVIDYKTGQAETKEWLGDRPDKPQLPLYAWIAAQQSGVAGEDELDGAARHGDVARLGGVAYGVVRAGKDAKLRGFAAEAELLGGKGRRPAMDAEDFTGQVERWGEVLEGLAGEFRAGAAGVRPKNYPGTCRHCGQRVLCRLDAALLEEIEDEDEADESDG